ncbi:hypothetical protein ACTS91_09570 [Empedobacter falsenii]|uniref:hypothetical protein n=1 Tax=unclassified Empedobacter TaxID=2643773 RepID=UPI002446E5C9|nr:MULTISPECIES: hypothetical protein [unclassified Empedobacter]MDH0658509.1 hypothetical protein [Empedobacter sp. GD03865]MDH0674804.1 hypothetical protein [Empedobacter sp. GD03861]
MNYKLLTILLICSISTFGQDRITSMTLENSASHIIPSGVKIDFTNTTSMFHPKDTDKIIVLYTKSMLKGKNEEKKILLSKKDFAQIEDQILDLNFSDFIKNRKTISLDGYTTKLSINANYEDNNTIVLETSDSQSNKLHAVITLILEKLNLKEKDFYR